MQVRTRLFYSGCVREIRAEVRDTACSLPRCAQRRLPAASLCPLKYVVFAALQVVPLSVSAPLQRSMEKAHLCITAPHYATARC